jgi:protein involved in polysaccharide export with SLBB domain
LKTELELTGPFSDLIPTLYEGMRISDLIAKAEGLKEDAYSKRARIIRVKSDLTTEIVTVDLEQALKRDLEADIALNRKMW